MPVQRGLRGGGLESGSPLLAEAGSIDFNSWLVVVFDADHEGLGRLLWIPDLEEGVGMVRSRLAILAEVKVMANGALISDADDRLDLTAVAPHVLVDDLLLSLFSRHFEPALHLGLNFLSEIWDNFCEAGLDKRLDFRGAERLAGGGSVSAPGMRELGCNVLDDHDFVIGGFIDFEEFGLLGSSLHDEPHGSIGTLIHHVEVSLGGELDLVVVGVPVINAVVLGHFRERFLYEGLQFSEGDLAVQHMQLPFK